MTDKYVPDVEVLPWEPCEDSAYVLKFLADLHQHHADMYREKGIRMVAPYLDLQDTNVMIIWHTPMAKHLQRCRVGVIVTDTSNSFQRAGVICDVIVERDWRRRGIARRAIELCITEMAEQGMEQVGLNVSTWNEGAVKLYEAMGFKATSQYMMMTLPEEVVPEEDEPFGDYIVRSTFGALKDGDLFGWDQIVYRKDTSDVLSPRCPNCFRTTDDGGDIFSDNMTVLVKDDILPPCIARAGLAKVSGKIPEIRGK